MAAKTKTKAKEQGQSSELVNSFAEIASEKGIDRDALQGIMEDVFRAMIRKRYGADDSFEIIFNPDNGDIQIIHLQEVVENMSLEDPVTQIELKDALLIDDETDIGEEVASEISIRDFGRRVVSTARQTFNQRIRDIEKENIYNYYEELLGEIVVGEIYQIRKREVLIMHNKIELILPEREQIPKDRYRKGDMIRAVVKEIKRDTGNYPQIIISRADPEFMERLFELEVPEIYENIVEIKNIRREPGERAKVAVMSTDDRVDPVGACVGMKGVRIHAVVRELNNENIDIVSWTDNDEENIKRSLAPAKPINVTINRNLEPPRAKVVVLPNEVSLAIGKGGQNIRLATALTGYEIDIYRDISEEEEDVDIMEFSDEIDIEILTKLQNIGCDTAKAVLELSKEELIRRSGMDMEMANHVINILKAEFDDEDDQDEDDD